MAIYVITASLSRNPHMTVFLHFFKSFHHLNTYLVFSCTVPSAGSPKPHTLIAGHHTSTLTPTTPYHLESTSHSLTLNHICIPSQATRSIQIISLFRGISDTFLAFITFLSLLFFIFLSSLLKTEKHLDQNGSKLEKEK